MVSVGFEYASGRGGSVLVASTARSAALSSVTTPLDLKIVASVIDPSRLIVKRIRLVPLAPWFWFHAARMRVISVPRYSGQQKSPVISSAEPEPAPPPVVRPKPWPRTPVSADVLPNAGCAPLLAVLPRASSGACFTVGDAARAGFAFGTGIVISGALAAGGAGASRAASGGVTS